MATISLFYAEAISCCVAKLTSSEVSPARGSGHEAPVRIAIIGAGYWGKKVIREILQIQRNTRRVELHSITDNSPTNLALCQQEFGPLDYRVDYQGLLPDPSIDAVYLSEHNEQHYEIASAFLEHGKSVLVEKPLATSSRAAYDLVRIAMAKKVVLSVGNIHRFNSGVRDLRKAIARGSLGEVYYLRFSWTGFLPPQTQGDVVWDLAPHPLDICNQILGQWPRNITCRGQGYRTPNKTEIAFITLEHNGGLAAQIELSWLDREKRREVTVVGSKGMAFLDCSEQTVAIRTSEGNQRVEGTPTNTLSLQIAHFAECVRKNKLSEPYNNLCPGILGAKIVELVEAAKSSLLEKQTVLLPQGSKEVDSISSADGSALVLVSELLSENRPESFFDPSSLDPDSLLSTEVASSVEAWIRSSKHRASILSVLRSTDMTPKDLAAMVGLDLSNLGKYVNELAYNGLVERKTPADIRKGRIYGITKKGRRAADKLAHSQIILGEINLGSE